MYCCTTFSDTVKQSIQTLFHKHLRYHCANIEITYLRCLLSCFCLFLQGKPIRIAKVLMTRHHCTTQPDKEIEWLLNYFWNMGLMSERKIDYCEYMFRLFSISLMLRALISILGFYEDSNWESSLTMRVFIIKMRRNETTVRPRI